MMMVSGCAHAALQAADNCAWAVHMKWTTPQ
jgi:hypothetical protein